MISFNAFYSLQLLSAKDTIQINFTVNKLSRHQLTPQLDSASLLSISEANSVSGRYFRTDSSSHTIRDNKMQMLFLTLVVSCDFRISSTISGKFMCSSLKKREEQEDPIKAKNTISNGCFDLRIDPKSKNAGLNPCRVQIH